MSRRDWTLLVVGAGAPERGLTPLQLQKTLFLLGKNLPSAVNAAGEPYYEFRAYDYGPFDENVYHDAEHLEAEGLISILRPPRTRFKQYLITPAGKRAAVDVQAKVGARTANYVGELARFTQSLSFDQLVGLVYRLYPEMRENSVFKG